MTESPRRLFSISRAACTFGVPLVLIGSISMFQASKCSIGAFFDPQTLFIVGGLSFFLLLGSHGKKFIAFLPEAIKTLFFDPAGEDPVFADIARDGERFSLASGLIGVVIGLITLLSNLEDPSTIGPAMAVSLLSMIYGLIFSEFFFGVVARAYQASGSPATITKHGPGMVFGGLFALLCCFFIMLFSFSTIPESSDVKQKNETTFTEVAIDTNLGSITDGHTIKLQACLSVSDPQTKDRIDSLVPAIQERIIQLVLKKDFAGMSGANAFEALKGEVTSIVNSLLKENGGREMPLIVFSEFLIK